MNWIARLGRTLVKDWQPWTGKSAPYEPAHHFFILMISNFFLCQKLNTWQPPTSSLADTSLNMTE
jgi:hypothetical protein